MISQKRIAIVTGSNKGIGFEIVQGLCKNFDGIVYLTCNLREKFPTLFYYENSEKKFNY